MFEKKKSKTVFEQKKVTPSAKHGGGNVMVWSCFAASGSGQPAVIESTINSVSYHRVLEENVRHSVKKRM